VEAFFYTPIPISFASIGPPKKRHFKRISRFLEYVGLQLEVALVQTMDGREDWRYRVKSGETMIAEFQNSPDEIVPFVLVWIKQERVKNSFLLL